MEDMPIDIHYNKLSDWLIKRRHCKQNWQDAALKIREKINSAIQDMPEHDGITKLLTGAHINYFHCLKIVEILKETEASSKNIFGSYSSQRMKDWQDIVQLYQVDCVYLAEAAQMLTRNVNYEVPALKKQVLKCKKSQQDCTKKESEYNSLATDLRVKYSDMCQKIGIEGKLVKKELLALAGGLPDTFHSIAKQTKDLEASLHYYTQFIEFINPGAKADEICPLLRMVIASGNVSTYEWRTGQPPSSIVDTTSYNQSLAEETGDTGQQSSGEEIDWGAIDFDEPEAAETEATIDFDIDIEVNDAGNAELSVDWGDSGEATTAVDKDDGVARGKDALTVLDNPATRFQFMDELVELQSFLEQRLHGLSASTDVIVMSLLQSAPTIIQMNESELEPMLTKVSAIIEEMSSSKLQQLMSIRNSPRYVERITEGIIKVLDQSEKMAASARLMIIKRQEAHDEEGETEPKIGIIKQKTLELKKQMEKAISAKYKDRVVNIMGEINAM